MMASLCEATRTLNASANGSWDEGVMQQRHTQIISTLLVLTSVVGVPLNGLALWVLGCKLRRKNRFVAYVMNLLLADFLFLLFQFVHSICRFAKVAASDPSLMVFRCIIVVCNEASAFLLTWISVERFLGMAFPIWWRLSRTKDSAVMAAWAIWGLSVILGVIYGVIRAIKVSAATKEGLVITEFTLAFLAPFVAFTLANALILCGPHRPSRKTSRLYRAITLNAVIFLMCWVPYHLCVFLHHRALSEGTFGLCVSAYYGAYYSICLLHVKSCVIPLVYISISSELKVKFRESLPSIFERRFSEESGLSSPGPEQEVAAKPEFTKAQN
ncbi:mas-related G-protein coupled receptor member A-like [Mustelus asterias]